MGKVSADEIKRFIRVKCLVALDERLLYHHREETHPDPTTRPLPFYLQRQSLTIHGEIIGLPMSNSLKAMTEYRAWFRVICGRWLPGMALGPMWPVSRVIIMEQRRLQQNPKSTSQRHCLNQSLSSFDSLGIPKIRIQNKNISSTYVHLSKRTREDVTYVTSFVIAWYLDRS